MISEVLARDETKVATMAAPISEVRIVTMACKILDIIFSFYETGLMAALMIFEKPLAADEITPAVLARLETKTARAAKPMTAVAIAIKNWISCPPILFTPYC